MRQNIPSCAQSVAAQVFRIRSKSIAFKNKTRKKHSDGSIAEILLKTLRKNRVGGTTNYFDRPANAKMRVVNVCRLLTNASVFRDSAAAVSNQWFMRFGHNQRAQVQTIT